VTIIPPTSHLVTHVRLAKARVALRSHDGSVAKQLLVMSVQKVSEKKHVPGSLDDKRVRFLRAHGVKQEAERDPMAEFA